MESLLTTPWEGFRQLCKDLGSSTGPETTPQHRELGSQAAKAAQQFGKNGATHQATIPPLSAVADRYPVLTHDVRMGHVTRLEDAKASGKETSSLVTAE